MKSLANGSYVGVCLIVLKHWFELIKLLNESIGDIYHLTEHTRKLLPYSEVSSFPGSHFQCFKTRKFLDK